MYVLIIVYACVGGLLDKPGNERTLVLDVDDVLLQRKTRSIPRADVAEICVESLLHPEARNKVRDATRWCS